MYEFSHVRGRSLRARRLTALGLALLFAPALWIAPAALAAPGGGWGLPAPIPGVGGIDSLGASSNNNPDIESDRDGNVFAVYDAWTGSNYAIFANRYVPALGWTGAVQINTPTYVVNPTVATDPHGNAFVVWSQWNGSAYVPAYSFYSTTSGWLAPREYTNNYTGGYPDQLLAGADGDGNAYIAFRYYNGTAYELWAGTVNINGSQQPLEVFNRNATLYQYALAASPVSGAVLAVSLYNGSYNVSAIRHVPGQGWLAPTLLEGLVGNALNPMVGIDDTGTALVWWTQSASGFSAYYATWSRTSGWSAARGAIPSYSIVAPILAVAPTGVAVVAFASYNGVAYVAGAARYSPGGGWQAPVRSADVMYTGAIFDLAIDTTGNAIFAYDQGAPGPARAAEFTSAGWGAPAWVMEDTSTYNVYAIRVASMGHGKAMVAAQEWTGANYQARVNLYSALDTAAPWVSIDRPFNGASYGNGFAEVTGSAEPGSQVTVNGAAALAFPNGSFVATVPLGEGVNVVRARAVDAAGNSGYSNTRTVTQTSPAPMLEAERAQAGRTGWLDPIRMDNLSLGGAWWPTLRTDGQGNAWAVWYEGSGSYFSVYASRYTKGVGWGTPTQMRAFNDGSIYDYPKLAVDPAGNAMVVWNQYNPGNTNITTWARLWLVFGGWQPETRMDNATQYSIQPEVAASGDGQFAVVWRQYDAPFNGATYAQLYEVGVGWGGRTRVSDLANLTHVPVVTFNATGVAYLTAAWRTGSIDRIVLATHPRGGNWANVTVIQNLSSVIATGAVIRTGLGANYTVAWSEQRGGVYDTRAGRFVNGTWQGSELIFANAWTWWPELVVDAEGYSFVAHTESSTGSGNAIAAVSRPGLPFASAVRLDNGTEHGGGPRLVSSFDRRNVSVLWDEVEGPLSRANWRSYDKAIQNWSAVRRISPDHVKAHIPDGGPTPDGGYIVVWVRDDLLLGFGQIDGVRYLPPETNPPSLVVTSPAPGFVTNVSTVRVQGTVEVGAALTINGVVASVAPNGSFALDVPLSNGTNSIYVLARDAAGNTNSTWRNGTFDDPNRRRIEQLEQDNIALQNQLNATNASLTAALAAQNATLLGALAAQNASQLAALAAQNTSLLGAIAGLNATLLAQMAAGDSALAMLIANTNASLLANLAAQNAALTQLIADTNASLLGELAGQNDALLAQIAQTNASLFAKLAAQNTSLLGAINSLNATLLGQLAAGDAALTQLIASTNMSLLASLAAQNTALTAQIAATNSSLLAALAAQNDDLLEAIAVTNASLLGDLARIDAALWAKLTADNGALWVALNASAAEAAATQAGLNRTNATVDDTQDSLANTREDLSATTTTAQGASMMSTLGLALAGAALLVGLIALMMWRKAGSQHAMAATEAPPAVGQVTVVEPAKPQGAKPEGEDEML